MKWFFAALALCAAGALDAQGYPGKPVRIIVTFTVGGVADLTARLVGDRLGELWKPE
jgi:tripartite-type tricarboxylate transporter receptor subunit TctC